MLKSLPAQFAANVSFSCCFCGEERKPNNHQCVWHAGLTSRGTNSETCAGENMIIWKTNCCFVLCMRGEGTNKKLLRSVVDSLVDATSVLSKQDTVDLVNISELEHITITSTHSCMHVSIHASRQYIHACILCILS